MVTFTGLCRDEAGTLSALELEHYPGMAEAEILRIARQAAERWPLTRADGNPPSWPHPARREHRAGRRRFVAPRCGFQAASFLMDYLKTRAPFWKKEHLREGGAGDWVESAKSSDDAAAKRW